MARTIHRKGARARQVADTPEGRRENREKEIERIAMMRRIKESKRHARRQARMSWLPR